jgi:hypothetical protein
MDPVWIEFQISSVQFAAFALSWYTKEVAFAVVWYALKMLELLILVLQWLIKRPCESGHVNIWGSPFCVPSYYITQLSCILVFIVSYYLYWKHRRPSNPVFIYTLLFVAFATFYLWLVPLSWDGLLLSLLLGFFYGWLVVQFMVKLFLPLCIDSYLTWAACPSSYWGLLLGSRNSLLRHGDDSFAKSERD